MNPVQTIQEWRANPELAALGARGWTVNFAIDDQQNMPALDYLDGTDPASDRSFPMSEKHLSTLIGNLQVIRTEGLDGRSPLPIGQFNIFKGDDAKEGMCEFRIVTNRGHRILCFRRPGRKLVVTSAFRKPPKDATPPQAKTRALTILQYYEAHRN